MFGLNWLKRRLKRRMQPIPADRARLIVHRLSILYAFVGWNFVSLLLYLTWRKHIPDGPGKLEKYVEILDVDHARVIKFDGFRKVADYDIDRTKEILEDTKRQRMVTDLNPPVAVSSSKEFINENSTGEFNKSF